MAEALAKKMFPDQTVEFVSAGTHPAKRVDEGAVVVLKEYGINCDGYPKTFSEMGDVDMIVTINRRRARGTLTTDIVVLNIIIGI